MHGICKILANKWSPSIKNDAIIAGLLHDIGKSMNRLELIRFCSENNVTMYDFEIFDNLTALHGKASSLLFEKEFKGKIEETEIARFNAISHAISCHVAGSETMTLLDKILFIADNIEPKRGNNILSQIKSGETKSPNKYIEQIIQYKLKKSDEQNRIHNPFLDSTLSTIQNEER